MSGARKASKEDVLKRLRRIEGQVRGVARMVDEDRDCPEIIQQLAAIRSATHQVSLLLMRDYACRCLIDSPEGESPEAIVEELINVLGKSS